MAKRVPLGDRLNQDRKGADAFFDPTPEVVSPNTNSSTQLQGDVAGSPASQSEISPSKLTLAKVTLYIRPDQVVSIEKIQLEQRQQTGRKPDKSDLVQEALDLLVEKYALK